ncbi:MAG: response regulator [Phycisphaeraceae bacterium]|nr:response regulator [Phycisphaeraceae bacterium]
MPRKARILIADDNPELLAAMKTRFEQINTEVYTALDGYTALSQAAKHQPDIMILDINMPAGDGFSVMERFSNLPETRRTKTIFITGDRSERLDKLAFDMGAMEVFHKPVPFKSLVSTVREALSPKAA